MICPRCAHAISDDSKFCTYCGQPMNAAPPAPAQPQNVEAPRPAPAPAEQPAMPLPEPVVPQTTSAEKAPGPVVPAQPVPAAMDFQTLAVRLGRAGLIVKTYACERCGSLIFLPPQGTTLHCMTCQNEISAQQVNERIRSVFGEK